MTALEMNGDDGRGGYLVALPGGRTRALIPPELIADQTGSTEPTDAEEWISAQSDQIATALRTMAAGGTPPAPFDRIHLIGNAI